VEFGSEVIRVRESLTRKDIRLAEITDLEGYNAHLIEEEVREAASGLRRTDAGI
jgi:hypothetical protein